jgi:hypothetical protein
MVDGRVTYPVASARVSCRAENVPPGHMVVAHFDHKP